MVPVGSPDVLWRTVVKDILNGARRATSSDDQPGMVAHLNVAVDDLDVICHGRMVVLDEEIGCAVPRRIQQIPIYLVCKYEGGKPLLHITAPRSKCVSVSYSRNMQWKQGMSSASLAFVTNLEYNIRPGRRSSVLVSETDCVARLGRIR